MVIRKLKKEDFHNGILEILHEHITDDVSVWQWNKYFSYIETTHGYEVLVATEVTLIIGVLIYTMIPGMLLTPHMIMRIEHVSVRPGNEDRNVSLHLMQHVINSARVHAVSRVVTTYDPAFSQEYEQIGFQNGKTNMLLYC